MCRSRARECFGVVADQAKRSTGGDFADLAHVVTENAATTTKRRLKARMRYVRFPPRPPSGTSSRRAAV
jgi:hypothetical protein